MQFDGFFGKLTTGKWAKIGKCSTDTALNDIRDLVNKGVLKRMTKVAAARIIRCLIEWGVLYYMKYISEPFVYFTKYMCS